MNKWAIMLALLVMLPAMAYIVAGCGPTPSGSIEEDSSPAPGADNSQEDAPSVAPGDRGQDTVHATRTGKRYHRARCRYILKSDIPMTRHEAEAKGLTPCGSCKP